MPETEVVQLNIERLRHDDASERVKAAQALGKLGDPRAVEPLTKALGDNYNAVRLAAAAMLGKLGDGRAAGPLIRALGDNDSDVRCVAAEALGKLGEPLWQNLVKGDTGDWQRLGDCGDKRAVEPLIKALGDDDGRVSRAAAEALGRLGDQAAKPSLMPLLAHSWPNVRIAASMALQQLGDSTWRSLINGDLEDFVRLGGTGQSYLVEPLASRLKASKRVERQAAARGLVALFTRSRAVMTPRWHELRATITAPHSEYVKIITQSSDCTRREVHADSGIGLKSPDPPAGDF
jgi:hypothetical protein